jgi:hypothetical protein
MLSEIHAPPSLASTTLWGPRRLALVATLPSPLYPAEPVPATVKMTPSDRMRRTRWLPKSQNQMPPDRDDEEPNGRFTCADEACPPSPLKPAVEPATVLIVPSDQTRLILCPECSTIMKPPSDSKDTDVGLLRRADVAWPPSPEKPAVPEPATVVMIPVGDTRRTTWLECSAIQIKPFGVHAPPIGSKRRADVADPPSPLHPATPVPATVVMVPPGAT